MTTDDDETLVTMELSTELDTKKKPTGMVAHASADVRVPDNMSLYDALRKRGLLSKPSFPSNIGMNLIQQGEIGLAMLNGKPRFISPGRDTFWSCFSHFNGAVRITEPVIRLGPVTIVTVNQGELGLSRRNGETICLDPGRYILVYPHIFERNTPANATFIELGTFRRICVPVNHVAIAMDNGRQIVITPDMTPYETNSPTFSFNPQTGFQSVQLQVSELQELKVNTRDGVTIICRGLLTYSIADPHKAFMVVQDVHGAIRRSAEATLTNIFLNVAIDQIAPSIPNHPEANSQLSAPLEGGYAENRDLSKYIREAFLHDFREKVQGLGVDVQALNIEKLEFDKVVGDLLRQRAQARIQTATNIANMYAQTEVAVQEAERAYKQRKIQNEADALQVKIKSDAEKYSVETNANAKAEAIKILADAEFYAASKRSEAASILSQNPLASRLEYKRLDVDIVKATGQKTTFLPLDLKIGSCQIDDPSSNISIWGNNTSSSSSSSRPVSPASIATQGSSLS